MDPSARFAREHPEDFLIHVPQTGVILICTDFALVQVTSFAFAVGRLSARACANSAVTHRARARRSMCD